MRRLIFLLAMLFVISAHDAVAEIAGRASVIDGDTIEIRGERIRLHGIDTPESSQLCDLDGQSLRPAGEKTVCCAEKDVHSAHVQVHPLRGGREACRLT